MTTIALTYKAIHRKVLRVRAFPVSFKTMYVLGLASCAVMLVFYIFSMNALTEGSYLIKNYNREVQTLSKENSVLEKQYAQLGFLGRVSEQVYLSGFEKTTAVTYMQIMEGALAAK